MVGGKLDMEGKAVNDLKEPGYSAHKTEQKHNLSFSSRKLLAQVDEGQLNYARLVS